MRSTPAEGTASAPAPSSLVWALVAARVLVHLALIRRHDFHRDELYFLACADRLAFGYVDHPPAIAWVAALASATFGPDLAAIRLPAVLAGGLSMWLTARVVRELGGGALATLLAGLAMWIAPAYLRMGSILCIPVFEPVFWTSASLLVLRIARGASPRWWLAVGAIVGLGFLMKHSILLWVAGTFVGLAATPLRSQLATRWPWLGAVVAVVFAAPNLIWQVQHDFATVEFLRLLSRGLERYPRYLFGLGQVLYMHPLTLPLSIGGLLAALQRPRGGPSAPHRWYGIAFLFCAAVLIATHGKPYYLAPAFPVLFALGATAIERLAARRAWRRAPWIYAGLLAASFPVLGVISLPVAPVNRVDAALERFVGWAVRPAELTGELHDQFGWREQVAVVQRVAAELGPEDRAVAVVLTGNYGQASAVLLLGRSLDLPVVSGHMSFHHWGVPEARGDVAIAYGLQLAELDRLYADVREVARMDHPLAWSGERDLPVFLCRSPRTPLASAWPSLKRFHHARAPPSDAPR